MPVLKLRVRFKVFSEQETGKPLQRSRCQLALGQGGCVSSLSAWSDAQLHLWGEKEQGLIPRKRNPCQSIRYLSWAYWLISESLGALVHIHAPAENTPRAIRAIPGQL